MAAFGPRRVVACCCGDGGLGAKDSFVLFADDDERDGRVEVQLRACLCVSGMREMRAEGMGGAVRTSDAGELLLEGRLEFTLGDTICRGSSISIIFSPPRERRNRGSGILTAIEQDSLRKLSIHGLSVLIEQMLESGRQFAFVWVGG